MESPYIFKRTERKYLIDEVTKKRLLTRMKDQLIPDEYGKSTICSLYLDTPDFRIIRNSIEAVAYKEKLRLRSYGVPTEQSTVYLELKKKYQGVVYKRRVSLSLFEARAYLTCCKMPDSSQIWQEIDYAMHFYGWPQPAMVISYEREAYIWAEDTAFRVTFDSMPRARKNSLCLESGCAGMSLLPVGSELMEVKSDGAMPLAFSRLLNEMSILPTSFSKYGAAYMRYCKVSEDRTEITAKGAMKHVSNL